MSNFLVCLPRKIEKMSCLAAKAQTQERREPVKSCVPVSVELVDKENDADENVDADQTSTGRLVSGQPTGLFTQLEEIDIDFRVSGLPHAVVKQAELPCSRDREEDRESSSSRSTSSRLAAK